MTPEERRRRRLGELTTKIRLAKEPQSLRALCGWMILKWGSKRATVREYIEDLTWAGLVEVSEQEDTVTWVG